MGCLGRRSRGPTGLQRGSNRMTFVHLHCSIGDSINVDRKYSITFKNGLCLSNCLCGYRSPRAIRFPETTTAKNTFPTSPYNYYNYLHKSQR